MVGNDSDKTYFLEEVLLFHQDKWQSLFVLVFLYLNSSSSIYRKKIMNPQECLQNKFWECILQNIVLHVKNTLKKIFAIKIVVSIFYNNKQKISSDEVRKNSVECFKKRQRSKEKPF